MEKGINRRQFLIGGSAVLASAAMLGVAGCAASGTEPAKGPEGKTAGGARKDGLVDTTKACYGQDTPGLASLEESIDYNQITSDESEKPTEPTISQDTVSYLRASDYGKPVDLMIEMLIPSTAKTEETPLVVWINGGGSPRRIPQRGWTPDSCSPKRAMSSPLSSIARAPCRTSPCPCKTSKPLSAF